MDGVFTVGEVVRYLRDILDEDVVLSGVWVEGEVSNLSHSGAGHTYFTLKDTDCQLKCVLFRGSARGQAALVKHGGQVLAHGRVSVYETQGSVQLYVDLVQPAGIGALHRRFEALCDALREEGLFAEELKRPIPALPRRIGVVTSAQAAAFQDICRVLEERFPAVEVVLAHTLVQGEDAPAQIVAALEHLGALGDIDVVILARGGGSLEDLWAFNDEHVARAVRACPVPVVTGVGHETDTTIADFAADLRAPTPSAAAMAVVPDRQELLGQIATLEVELRRVVVERMARERAQVALLARELELRSPMRRVEQQRQVLDELALVLRERALHHIMVKGERLRSRHLQLKLLDPLRTLDRGFALVTDGEGRIVRDIAAISAGDSIGVRLRDGSFPATVSGPPVVGRPGAAGGRSR